MIKIQKHGAVLRTNADGYLIPDVSLDNIVPPWDEAVNFIKEAYIKHLGKRLHSVYIRGSVARGLAVEGISDVDSFALVHGDPPEQEDELDWAKRVIEQYMKRFPFSHRPEILINGEKSFCKNLEGKWWLRLGAICIYGENLIPRIPPVKFETVVADFQFQRDYISKIVDQFHEGIKNAESERSKGYCRWICKRFLRVGMGLVLPRAKVFTRDLYYCYEEFVRFYPQRDTAMWQALEFAINPTEDKEVLFPLVEVLGNFLSQEADTVFGAPCRS